MEASAEVSISSSVYTFRFYAHAPIFSSFFLPQHRINSCQETADRVRGWIYTIKVDTTLYHALTSIDVILVELPIITPLYAIIFNKLFASLETIFFSRKFSVLTFSACFLSLFSSNIFSCFSLRSLFFSRASSNNFFASSVPGYSAWSYRKRLPHIN